MTQGHCICRLPQSGEDGASYPLDMFNNLLGSPAWPVALMILKGRKSKWLQSQLHLVRQATCGPVGKIIRPQVLKGICARWRTLCFMCGIHCTRTHWKRSYEENENNPEIEVHAIEKEFDSCCEPAKGQRSTVAWPILGSLTDVSESCRPLILIIQVLCWTPANSRVGHMQPRFFARITDAKIISTGDVPAAVASLNVSTVEASQFS